ncbi:MAG TPA: AzlD domain-containing protein [Coriobacteriia bacterium]
MNATLVWSVIIGMAVTNVILRFVPLAILSRVALPRVVERWLSFVPVTVMAAVTAVEVLRPGGHLLPLTHNPYLLAAVPTAIVYRVSRSLLGATLVGVAAFLAFGYLLG